MGRRVHGAVVQWVRDHLLRTYRSVLECGSLDINGGIRGLLDPRASYLGIDVQTGRGVDLVTDFATYRGNPVDLVLCLEVFEHTVAWPALIESAAANLVVGGCYLATCATTGRGPHSARSESPIQADEWYRNVTESELRTELEKWFEAVVTQIAGTDLRVACIR